ncbi:hypothetical protein MBAV_005518 [Candidatus Magnetobacterium bavaricum]|uniref:Uncharacterized protein n=1 Tax=Candidatus Magnetobacterium bavaricum TaxID=29290 RepID=A0A0F3GK95_9BACT|nr:hypothetical protein MBAV_005518 [Candidatus Magnetobacterium bavaricum]
MEKSMRFMSTYNQSSPACKKSSGVVKKFERVIDELKRKDTKRKELKRAVAKIRHEFRSLPNVKKIACKVEGKRLMVWTFVDNYECSALIPIYDKELEIIEKFAKVEFIFTTIFNPDEDVPIGFVVDYLDTWHHHQ